MFDAGRMSVGIRKVKYMFQLFLGRKAKVTLVLRLVDMRRPRPMSVEKLMEPRPKSNEGCLIWRCGCTYGVWVGSG